MSKLSFFYILEIYDPNLDFIDDYEYDGNSYINPIIAMNVLNFK